jgi:hypothetical protein
MNPVIFHHTFAASYECSPLDELPGTSQGVRYFTQSGRQQSTHDGLLAHIVPENGASWVGVFEWGDVSITSGLSGFWSLPQDDSVCAVSRGVAYIVPVIHPEAYDVLPLRPVCHVLPVPSSGVLVFGDFVRLTAIGRQGKRLWTTQRLSWDGLQMSGVEGKHLVGSGWDAPSQKWVDFRVDLETGDHEGGSAPPS